MIRSCSPDASNIQFSKFPAFVMAPARQAGMKVWMLTGDKTDSWPSENHSMSRSMVDGTTWYSENDRSDKKGHAIHCRSECKYAVCVRVIASDVGSTRGKNGFGINHPGICQTHSGCGAELASSWECHTKIMVFHLRGGRHER